MNNLRLVANLVARAVIDFVNGRILPTHIDFNSLEPEQAIDDGSQFVDVMGLRVRTRIAGKGQPVMLLLHGFAASVFSWHKVFDELSKLGTVIAYDRLAYGFTSLPNQATQDAQNPYILEAQPALAFALLDHFGIDRAIVVGHSAGGAVATLMALDRPDRVESLVLVAPAIYTDVCLPPWLRWLVDRPLMSRAGHWIARTIAGFANMILNYTWHDPAGITPEIREGYVKPFRITDWDMRIWTAACVNRPADLSRRLHELKTPTLVVTGDDDRIVPITDSRRVARQIPNSSLIVIPNCGHLSQEERPRAFLDAVIPVVTAARDRGRDQKEGAQQLG